MLLLSIFICLFVIIQDFKPTFGENVNYEIIYELNINKENEQPINGEIFYKLPITKETIENEINKSVYITNKENTFIYKNIYKPNIKEVDLKNTFYPLEYKEEVKKYLIQGDFKESNYNKFEKINLQIMENLSLEEKKQPYTVSKKILEYVPTYLNYSLETKYRNSNIDTIIEHQIGVCEDYAILMKELLIYNNIPARTVYGLVYEEKYNKIEYHSWVEGYFENYGWITFDPTRTNFEIDYIEELGKTIKVYRKIDKKYFNGKNLNEFIYIPYSYSKYEFNPLKFLTKINGNEDFPIYSEQLILKINRTN